MRTTIIIIVICLLLCVTACGKNKQQIKPQIAATPAAKSEPAVKTIKSVQKDDVPMEVAPPLPITIEPTPAG
jgi:ABC-type enterochelin transport system substrate-binding protein